MSVVGAVVTLSPDPDSHQHAMAALHADATWTLGELQGTRLPVVFETPSTRDDRDRFDQLRSLPGVLAADPVFAAFPDLFDTAPEVCP